MSWDLVQLGQIAPAPWRNGRGITRELLAWPQGQDWTVRLSVAEVTEDGEFSRLPGVRRWFAVLCGEGVRLRIDGSTHQMGARTPPFQFDGASYTVCELLAGPTRDFNLMLRQGTALMERVSGACARPCRANTLVAAYANCCQATAGWHGVHQAIPPNALAWRILESDGLVQFAGDDALWMEIAP